METSQKNALLHTIKNEQNEALNYFINSILFGDSFLFEDKKLEDNKLAEIRNKLYSLNPIEYDAVIKIIKDYGEIKRNNENRKSNTATYNPNVLKHNQNEENSEKDDDELKQTVLKRELLQEYLNNQSVLFNEIEKKVMGFFIQNMSKFEDTRIGDKLYYRTLEMIFLKIKIHHTILNKSF